MLDFRPQREFLWCILNAHMYRVDFFRPLPLAICQPFATSLIHRAFSIEFFHAALFFLIRLSFKLLTATSPSSSFLPAPSSPALPPPPRSRSSPPPRQRAIVHPNLCFAMPFVLLFSFCTQHRRHRATHHHPDRMPNAICRAFGKLCKAFFCAFSVMTASFAFWPKRRKCLVALAQHQPKTNQTNQTNCKMVLRTGGGGESTCGAADCYVNAKRRRTVLGRMMYQTVGGHC